MSGSVFTCQRKAGISPTIRGKKILRSQCIPKTTVELTPVALGTTACATTGRAMKEVVPFAYEASIVFEELATAAGSRACEPFRENNFCVLMEK